MKILYLLHNSNQSAIIRVTDLAKVIEVSLTRPLGDVYMNYAVIYFSSFSIFHLMMIILMDQIWISYTRRFNFFLLLLLLQHRTLVLYKILHAMKSTRNATWATNSKKEEIINCKYMLDEVCEQCNLYNHLTKFISASDLKRFDNELTVILSNMQQKLKFVKYPGKAAILSYSPSPGSISST